MAAVPLPENSFPHSFVIDEIALTTLLEKAWLPVGKKILRQLSGAVDFARNRYLPRQGLNAQLWLLDDMYDDVLSAAWDKIAKRARTILESSYDRGVEEEGRNPFLTPVAKAQKRERAQKSVSSVYAERKANAIAILTSMVGKSFQGYAREQAIPAARGALDGLADMERKVRETLAAEDQKLLADTRQIEQYEMQRRLRVAALRNVQTELVASLKERVSAMQHAQMVSNLATARAHHFGFLDWAQENGIEYYAVEATLDSRTCAACAAMDGKVFRIRDALAYKERFLELQGDVAALKDEMPFLTKEAVAESVRGVMESRPETWLADLKNLERLPEEFRGIPDPAFRHFPPDRYAVAEYMEETYRAWADTISEEEMASIRAYKLKGNRFINAALRSGKPHLVHGGIDYGMHAERLTNIFLEKPMPLKDSIVVYRGTSPDFYREFLRTAQVGGLATPDKGFFSASPNFSTAMDFFEGLLFKVYLPRGSTAAIYLDAARFNGRCSDETELLLRPGGRFKVLAINLKDGFVELLAVE